MLRCPKASCIITRLGCSKRKITCFYMIPKVIIVPVRWIHLITTPLTTLFPQTKPKNHKINQNPKKKKSQKKLIISIYKKIQNAWSQELLDFNLIICYFNKKTSFYPKIRPGIYINIFNSIQDKRKQQPTNTICNMHSSYTHNDLQKFVFYISPQPPQNNPKQIKTQ